MHLPPHPVQVVSLQGVNSNEGRAKLHVVLSLDELVGGGEPMCPTAPISSLERKADFSQSLTDQVPPAPNFPSVLSVRYPSIPGLGLPPLGP